MDLVAASRNVCLGGLRFSATGSRPSDTAMRLAAARLLASAGPTVGYPPQPYVPAAAHNDNPLNPRFRPTRGNVQIEPCAIAIPARIGDGVDLGRSELRHVPSLAYPTIFTTGFLGLQGALWVLTRPTYGLAEHENGVYGALSDFVGFTSGGEGVRQ